MKNMQFIEIDPIGVLAASCEPRAASRRPIFGADAPAPIKKWGNRPRRRYLALVGAVLAALTAGPALAQDQHVHGIYASIGGGLASLSDATVTYYAPKRSIATGGTASQDTLDTHFAFDNGAEVRGALGYDFGIIRADVEVGYARNGAKAVTIDRLNGGLVTLTPADITNVCGFLEADNCHGSGNTVHFDGGHVRQLSALGNLWIDLPMGRTVVPYAGGGVIGYEVDGEGKARFGWQLGTGVAVKLASHVAVTLDYRHRQAQGATIADQDFPNEGVIVGKLRSNSFSAGLRVRF